MPRRAVCIRFAVLALALAVPLLSACQLDRLREHVRAGTPHPSATPVMVGDCHDPVTSRQGPCPLGSPPVFDTVLACAVRFSHEGGYRWTFTARLELEKDDRPLAGQPVQWTVPNGLIPVDRQLGMTPVIKTDQNGVSTLVTMTAAGGNPRLQSARASFTDPPPHTGRTRILGDSSCAIGVPIPYPPPTVSP